MLQLVLDLFVSIVGAFVGFGFALFLDKQNIKQKRKSTIKKALSSINEELIDISSSIEKYLLSNKVLEQEIPIPAWEAVLYSGILLDLIEYPGYNGIINVYSAIISFNKFLYNASSENKQERMRDILDKAKFVEQGNRELLTGNNI